jgi:alkylhydroperoxidase family enzyme
MRASMAKAMSGCICSTARRQRSERAALAWTEAVTKISDRHVPDEVYEEARRNFSEKELVDLTAAVIAINAWNRAAIAFRATPPLTSVKIAA